MAGNKSKRWKLTIFVLVTVVIVLIGLSAGVFFSTGRSIEANLAAIKKLGVPTTSAELKALGQQSGADATSQYKIYLKKRQHLTPAETSALKVLSPRAKGYTAAQRESAILVIRPLLEPLRKGARMQRWTIPPDRPLRNVDASLRQVSDNSAIRSGAKLLCAMAIADYDAQKREEAISELRDALAISGQVGQNPGLMNGFLQMDLERQVFVAVRKILKDQADDKRVLSDVAKLLRTLPPSASFKSAVYEQFVQSVDVYQAVKDFKPAKEQPRETPTDYIKDQIYQRQIALDFALYRQAFTSLSKSPDWGWEDARTVFLEIDSQHRSSPTYSGTPNLLASCADSWGLWLAERRMMLVGVQILQMRAKTGVVPKSLPDFGADSIDPFSGKPFGYKPSNPDFVLYSVGADRQDNGGLHKGPAGENGDIIYGF